MFFSNTYVKAIMRTNQIELYRLAAVDFVLTYQFPFVARASTWQQAPGK